MPKAKLAGAAYENRPSPSEGKSKGSGKIDFKATGSKVVKANPLVGSGYDSRPRYDDNRKGATRGSLAGGSTIDGDKLRSKSTSGPNVPKDNPGKTKKEKY